ncbi:xanthine dehydrogenase family protein molybdopterin-binding subunit [Acetobacterium sp.]|uniref:xanthine dehydrogenase family protein molybdopterin-binding subunit n=1 Tax=Acetobacterium sp. TaxID=1872094 RepID=UPI002F3E8C28
MKRVNQSVNKPIRKKDAMALVTGKPVYTQDIAPKDCLVVKVLRSPHAHARIRAINTQPALKIPGIACVLTYKDVPDKRFTLAGQTFPEPSPYDRLILDETLRFIGDAVAIVAGENEKVVEKALKRIKVDYEVLEPVLDFRKALDNKVIIHPEESWKSLVNVGADQKRNLCAHGEDRYGDADAIIRDCAWTIEQTYHTKANQQVTMETFRTFTYQDAFGRLTCVSSTQIPFHARRILSNALDLPKSQIRVIKPRIGGGFGSKQTVISEIYPALVTLKTGKPAMIIYTRQESQIASSPRHEMEVTVRLGADEAGIIKGIDMQVLSNTGAYGEHGPTTVVLTGHKSIPLYGKAQAYRFGYDVVYTNKMSSGAYRGYGATQGIFALESAVNELAAKMNMDPVRIREINMVDKGDVMPAYFGETLSSCALSRCMKKAKEMMGWDEKYPCIDLGNGKVRSLGVAMAMQGSGIAGVDTAAVSIKVNDDGFYSMAIGAADMGTGCDTILAQIAADCLNCSVDDIIVSGVDTDFSPYDTGSYASSTTYVTGMAVVKTCEKLIEKIKQEGAKRLDDNIAAVDFDGDRVYLINTDASISLKALGNQAMCGNNTPLFTTASFSSPVSPPPFIVGMAEVEIDKETGAVDLIRYVAVVDCGTVINPNLARVQTEGGIAQGIGMALYEDIVYTEDGRNASNSLMQYKIPTRLDVGDIQVDFESSYEPTGPFGAKSIGELVISTPPPAIANAVYNGMHVQIRELPITAEKIVNGMTADEKSSGIR